MNERTKLNVRMIAALILVTGLVAWAVPDSTGCVQYSAHAGDC